VSPEEIFEQARAGGVLHIGNNPDDKAQAFNRGYDNIHDEEYKPNPYIETHPLHSWWEHGEQTAIQHREAEENEAYWEHNCGMDHLGFCSAAGSEECDFECPFNT
jgi:hypothetical protein